jgi:hypothetical protein
MFADDNFWIGPPASTVEIEALERLLAISVGDHARELFLCFNGAQVRCALSLIEIHSIQVVMDNFSLSRNIEGRIVVPIANFAFDAKFYLCDLSNGADPVYCSETLLMVAPSLSSFVTSLANGDYDGLPP